MPGFCMPFAAGVRAERWEEDGIGTRLYRRSRLFNEVVVSKIDILLWFVPIANRECEPAAFAILLRKLRRDKRLRRAGSQCHVVVASGRLSILA